MIIQGLFKRPLIPVLLALAGGILLSDIGAFHHLGASLFLVLMILSALSVLLFFWPRFRSLSLIFLFFTTGIFFQVSAQEPSRILSLTENGQKTVVEGVVLSPPRYDDHMSRFDLRAHTLFTRNEVFPLDEKIRVSVYNNPPSLSVGNKIRFPCRAKPFRNFNNPGCFDYKKAMRIKGYKCAASVSDGRTMVPMGSGQLPFPGGFVERLQRPARNFLAETLEPADASFFQALLLGERQAITHNQREPFTKTGLGHVLAVSGLHVGLVAWAAFQLFKGLLSFSYGLMLKTDVRKIAAILASIFVIWYTCLAGFQISTQRAMIMVLAFLFSIILGRENETWSTLALAALLILSLDPLSLFSISFQLSFCAVIGLLWLTPALLTRLPMSEIKNGWRKTTPLLGIYTYFFGLMAVSLCATVFLLPMTSFYFNRISLVAIPANITVIPFLGLWVIPAGLLSTIVLPLSSTLAGAIISFSSWGLHLVNHIIHFWAGLDWAFLWVFKPNLFEIFLFYSSIFCVYFVKRIVWAKIGIVLLSVLVLADVGYWINRVKYNQDLKVRFFDVGQANAALVEFPSGKKMLIDGGGFPGSDFDVGQMVLAPSLWHSKILTVQYIVLSHPQSDHMNGLRFISEAFHPEEFWYNGTCVKTNSFRELMAIVDAQGLIKKKPGDLETEVWINGVRIDLLHPTGRMNSPHEFPKDLNNNSLVLKITYQGKSFLFPGDIERGAEEILVSRRGNNLKSDILLCPHHGSRTSCTKGFLHMVKPRVCIISSGKGNRFRFPHPGVLQRLEEIGCRVLRTDQEGAIHCQIDNNTIEINTYLNGPLR